jgi:hypothetical protein
VPAAAAGVIVQRWDGDGPNVVVDDGLLMDCRCSRCTSGSLLRADQPFLNAFFEPPPTGANWPTEFEKAFLLPLYFLFLA